MEIRNIITFVRIAELQNFSKAARQLGYSQSAVTMQIKQLEEELHAQLFDRLGKHIRLTQAGQRLLPHALESLDGVRRAQGITREPEEVSGRLRIGTAESLLINVLPPIIIEFSRLHPRVEISTQTASVADLFAMVQRNEIDLLYFLDRKTNFPEWIKVAERPEPAVFVASARSRLAGQPQISLEQLLEEPFLLTEKGISYRYAMEQVLAERSMELHPFLETGNTDIITKMLLENRGISFLPEFVVRDYIQDGRLAVLDTVCPEICMWSQLVYHKNKYLTPQMERFAELMVRQIGSGPLT